MAGICVQLCVLPVDMVVTRIQVNRGAAPKGFVRTMYDVTKEGGILVLEWVSSGNVVNFESGYNNCRS